MALNGENGGVDATMLVGPATVGNYGGNYGGFGVPYAVPVLGGYGGYGGGYGGFGGDWSALIVLFILAAMFGGGGWGGGFGGFGGFGDGAFPWLLNGQNGINNNVSDGFRSAAISSQLGDIQTSITTGFSNSEVAACNRAMADQALSFNNQIADLNRSFDAQTAVTNGINGLSSQLADCCCENRLATQGLQSVILSENAADREALSNGIRDILTAQTAGTQRILDQLCNDKIDAKNERIAELQTQVNMQNLAASQAAQTAALIADNNQQSRDLIQRIAPYPIPAYPVGNPYGYGYGYGNCNGNGWSWNNGFGFNPFGNVGFGNGSF